MNFDLEKSLEILNRTPKVLTTLLTELSDDWLRNNEGEDTWSPYDVVGHLIHGEKTDWIERTKIILSDSNNKTFKPFDRNAQMNANQDISIDDLLFEFSSLRKKNLTELKSLNLTDDKLTLKGIHPALGEVTLKQLLSCWTVHDLGHLVQISRVMAKQYKSEVGPWIEYLGILKS